MSVNNLRLGIRMLMNKLLNEPVRIFSILAALLPLGAYYGLDLPAELILPVIAAILGVGEVVRSQVTPTRKLINMTAEGVSLHAGELISAEAVDFQSNEWVVNENSVTHEQLMHIIAIAKEEDIKLTIKTD